MADQTNPWDTTPAADSAAQNADARSTPSGAPTDGGGADWLTSAPRRHQSISILWIRSIKR